MGDTQGDKSIKIADASSSASELNALQLQIEAHREHDKEQSILKRGIGLFTRADKESLTALEKLQQEVLSAQKNNDKATLQTKEKEIATTIQLDRQALTTQDEIN